LKSECKCIGWLDVDAICVCVLNRNVKVLGAYFRNGTYTLLRDRQTDREEGERERERMTLLAIEKKVQSSQASMNEERNLLPRVLAL
jgi:hypothetical protein